MRIVFPTLLALAVVACATTTAPDTDELELRGEASSSCIDNRDWAATVNRGEFVYQDNCDYCHQDNGAGKPGEVPALVGNESLLTNPERAINLILVTKGKARPKHGMAVDDLVAIFDDLTAADIADVLTYARASWGNCAGPVSESDVKAVAAKM